jgi:seryl-tRNA synthetase
MTIGGDPEKVKASERARFRDDSIVDQIIEIDNRWRKSKLIAHFLNTSLNSEIRS